MNIEIKKLSKDLLDDWLYFFDNIAFSSNKEWSGCYCIHYHWSCKLADGRKAAGKDSNREYAIKLINEGVLQGYLAYCNNNVVGWCNTNDKQAYDTTLFDFPWDSAEKGKRIKAIVCFNISPEFRGEGIASEMLAKICQDTAEAGYEYIEAYPFLHDKRRNYHGPISMYEKNGFLPHGNKDDYTIVRKYFKL